jgi:tryptophanyl-tRNA synthetase
LQDALNCIVVIQLSDTEKFFFKSETNTPKSLDDYRKLGYKNAKDIIACGFDINKTFIFSDLEFNGGSMYFNNVLLMKATTSDQIQNIYGLGNALDSNVVNLCSEALQTETDTDKRTAYEKIVKNYSNKTQSDNIGSCVWPCFQCAPSYCTSFRDLFIYSFFETIYIFKRKRIVFQ